MLTCWGGPLDGLPYNIADEVDEVQIPMIAEEYLSAKGYASLRVWKPSLTHPLRFAHYRRSADGQVLLHVGTVRFKR